MNEGAEKEKEREEKVKKGGTRLPAAFLCVLRFSLRPLRFSF